MVIPCFGGFALSLGVSSTVSHHVSQSCPTPLNVAFFYSLRLKEVVWISGLHGDQLSSDLVSNYDRLKTFGSCK